MSDQREPSKKQIKSYRDLRVWKQSMDVVTDIYKTTHAFPQEELYGLTAQMRRCAVSIPSNIAEGYGRGTTHDYLRFLRIAMGSLYELQTQLQIAVNLEFVTQDDVEQLFSDTLAIEKMLSALIGKLMRR